MLDLILLFRLHPLTAFHCSVLIVPWDFSLDARPPVLKAKLAQEPMEGLRVDPDGAPVQANPNESEKNGKPRNCNFKTHRKANQGVREERDQFAEMYLLALPIGLGEHAYNGRGVFHPNQLEVRIRHRVGACIGRTGRDDGASLSEGP